jgi:hypothetical protein
MQRRLDKGLLRRLNQIQPPIDQDVLADTLCDGELLAVILDRWVIAQFAEIHGVIVNMAICDDPTLTERIPSMVDKYGHKETEEQVNRYYDFEIINDPASPPRILEYVLHTLAYLWEMQANQQFPGRKIRFRVGNDPTEGVDGASFIQLCDESDAL